MKWARLCAICGVAVWTMSACGLPDPVVPPELLEQQPVVTKALPDGVAVLAPTAQLELTFSHPVEPSTVNENSILMLPNVSADDDDVAILEQWKDGADGAVALHYGIAQNQREVLIWPAANFPPGRMALVVSPWVMSTESVPARAYVAFYQVAGSVGLSEAGQGDGGMADADAGSPPPPPSGPPPPTELMINEILYDVEGSDTNGDLFIELRGTPGGGLGGYVLRLMNGDGGAELEAIVLPDHAVIPDDGIFVVADGITGNLEATNVIGADLVDNFDPQNGPDAIQLLAPDGMLVDVVGYGSPLALRDESGLLMYETTPAPDCAPGQSLSRLPEAADTDDNSLDFFINTAPSPGVLDVILD